MEAIVFSSAGCAPCKVYKESTLEPLIKEGYKIAYVSIDDEDGRQQAIAHGVRAVPTTVIKSEGATSTTLVGLQTQDRLKGLLDG